jgi:hypothetical protein
MTCQEADHWCWAAVAQLVEQAYSSTVTQANIATHHVSRHTPGALCTALDPATPSASCGNNCAAACNSPHRLSIVLSERGRLNGVQRSRPPFNEIARIIDGGLPVPVRIGWNGGLDGHFVCVVGYADDGNGILNVEVLDPLDPGMGGGPASLRTLSYLDLTTAYMLNSQSGSVTHYYEV